MEYTDYRFKFDDKDAAIAALSEYRYSDEEGNQSWLLNGYNHALDAIGSLFDIIENPEDPESPEIQEIPGYHINLRIWDGRENPAPNQTIVPLNPRRIWA